MAWTTWLLFDIPIRFTPYIFFLAFSTFLLYNFHRYSIELRGAATGERIIVAGNIATRLLNSPSWLIALFGLIVSTFFLPLKVIEWLIPPVLLAIGYSIPFFRRGKRITRLSDNPVKTATLSIVWGITTTTIPLLEQNIVNVPAFEWLLSTSLFVFSLCIPFELRDIEKDKQAGMKTISIILGYKWTRIMGVLSVLIDMAIHRMIPAISLPSVIALDVASIVSLMWILFQKPGHGIFYYKLYVDGTMLLRFVLIVFVHQL